MQTPDWKAHTRGRIRMFLHIRSIYIDKYIYISLLGNAKIFSRAVAMRLRGGQCPVQTRHDPSSKSLGKVCKSCQTATTTSSAKKSLPTFCCWKFTLI